MPGLTGWKFTFTEPFGVRVEHPDGSSMSMPVRPMPPAPLEMRLLYDLAVAVCEQQGIDAAEAKPT